jgi:hypothetical protein
MSIGISMIDGDGEAILGFVWVLDTLGVLPYEIELIHWDLTNYWKSRGFDLDEVLLYG